MCACAGRGFETPGYPCLLRVRNSFISILEKSGSYKGGKYSERLCYVMRQNSSEKGQSCPKQEQSEEVMEQKKTEKWGRRENRGRSGHLKVEIDHFLHWNR